MGQGTFRTASTSALESGIVRQIEAVKQVRALPESATIGAGQTCQSAKQRRYWHVPGRLCSASLLLIPAQGGRDQVKQ